MQENRILFEEMLSRYNAGTATEPERRFVEQYMAYLEAHPSAELGEDAVERMRVKIAAQLAERRMPVMTPVHRIHFLKRWRWAAAAAVVIIATSLVMLLNRKLPVGDAGKALALITAPTANKATIRLNNGKLVYLDSMAAGAKITIDGVTLTKLADGKIAYAGNGDVIAYNTASNPAGSTAIDLELGDKTHVWLNAGSSITYPVAFAARDRSVRMTGEAYFEVSHDPGKPFIVQKDDLSVQVYGTHFNVKAYDNEPNLKVTLLEGSVGVTSQYKRQMLKPGQQAVVADASIRLVEDADIEEAVAWKNGKTSFHSADLRTVLREIERWYAISIEIKGDVPEKSFYADVNRNAPLSDVLKVLDDNNVKYSFDAQTKKLTVTQ